MNEWNALGINIGPGTTSAIGQQLCWTAAFPKKTVEGTTFTMYAGLYYYLITKGNHRRLLNAETESDLKCATRFQYQNVIGLATNLESQLLYNLRRNPLVVKAIRESTEDIVWINPLRGLSNREQRWLRVVRRAVGRIRRDCL